MKHAIIKNILITLFPIAFFWSYQTVQIRLRMLANRTFVMLPSTLFEMFIPLLVGAFAFYIAAYVYTNRRTLMFIYMFCGAFIANMYGVLCSTGVLGSYYMMLWRQSAASQLVYILVGMYVVGFWVSLVCYIKEKTRLLRMETSNNLNPPTA